MTKPTIIKKSVEESKLIQENQWKDLKTYQKKIAFGVRLNYC